MAHLIAVIAKVEERVVVHFFVAQHAIKDFELGHARALDVFGHPLKPQIIQNTMIEVVLRRNPSVALPHQTHKKHGRARAATIDLL